MELSGKQRKPSVYGGWLGFAGPTKELHAKIGLLTLENDFLQGALSKAGLLSVKR